MQLCISCVRKTLGNRRGNTNQNWNKSLALLYWPAAMKWRLKSVPAQLPTFQGWFYSEILGEVAFFHGWLGRGRGQGWNGHESISGCCGPISIPNFIWFQGFPPAMPTSVSAHDFFHPSRERLIISLLFPFRVGTLPKVYLFKNWESVVRGYFVKLDPYGLNSPFSAAFFLWRVFQMFAKEFGAFCLLLLSKFAISLRGRDSY